MKKLLFLFVCAFVALSASAQNPIKNGGFESGKLDGGWVNYKKMRGITVVAEKPHSGKYVAKVLGGGATNFILEKGKYIVKAYVKVDRGEAVISISKTPDMKSYKFEEVVSETIPVGAQYKEVAIPIKVKEQTRMRFAMSSKNNNGQFFIDDVSVSAK